MDIDTLDKLEQLGELKEKGLITQFEFDTQKEKLLFQERLSVQNEPQERNSGENITWGEFVLSVIIGTTIGIVISIVISVILDKFFSIEILPVERIFEMVKNTFIRD